MKAMKTKPRPAWDSEPVHNPKAGRTILSIFLYAIVIALTLALRHIMYQRAYSACFSIVVTFATFILILKLAGRFFDEHKNLMNAFGIILALAVAFTGPYGWIYDHRDAEMSYDSAAAIVRENEALLNAVNAELALDAIDDAERVLNRFTGHTLLKNGCVEYEKIGRTVSAYPDDPKSEYIEDLCSKGNFMSIVNIDGRIFYFAGDYNEMQDVHDSDTRCTTCFYYSPDQSPAAPDKGLWTQTSSADGVTSYRDTFSQTPGTLTVYDIGGGWYYMALVPGT